MNVLRSVSTGGGQREVPDYLTCGITFALMRDPVITPAGVAHTRVGWWHSCAGYTYDRAAIMQYLDAGGNTDPNTRTPLAADQLVPNRAVKLAIEHFITGNHWAVDGM
jgi:STIP1 family protein 1